MWNVEIRSFELKKKKVPKYTNEAILPGDLWVVAWRMSRV